MSITKKYEPVGFCIYCGSTGPLTDEHPVPEGIGGEHLLPDASCNTCARTTSQFEQNLQWTMFHLAREQLGAFGKRHARRKGAKRKSKPPIDLPVTIHSSDGQKFKRRVPITQFPFALISPLLDAPGILAGREPREPWPDLSIPGRVWINEATYNQHRVNTILREHGMKVVGTVSHTVELPLGDFCRLLAKIAYSTIMAHLPDQMRRNLFRFSPLPKYIIDPESNSVPFGHYMVGCAYWADGSRITSIASGKGNHEIVWYTHVFQDGQLFGARIQLFALIDAPVYEVVVAWPKISSNSEST